MERHASVANRRELPQDDLPRAELGVRSGAIVEAIITLGMTLGMQVVAEGVETPEQFNRLRAMNCPAAQGFWFCRPLHQDAVNDFLRTGSATVMNAGSASH